MMSAIRRNTETSLLVLSTIIGGGGLWLLQLSQEAVNPAEVIGYTSALFLAYGVAHLSVRKWARSADSLLLPIASLLFSIGFVLIARLEVSPRTQATAAAQLRWLGVGIAAFALTLYLVKDVRSLARYRYTFALAGVALLLLPMLPGIGREINGARLWIRIGALNFQPAELGKIALVLFFAGYFAERSALLRVAKMRLGPIGIPDGRHFGPVLLAWGISLLVMINQKDLGSSLLFFAVFVIMLWAATSRPAYLLVGTLLFSTGALAAYNLFSHVQTRIEIWRDPFAHIEERGFQLVQSMFALATGGAWGTGIGLGTPDLIPSVQTDFIFSALGEELGLAGTTAVLIAYALFASKGFGIATRCRDDFSKLLAAGLTTAFALQTILIIGGVTRLIPLTGVTLPFVSYGGSSLLSNFILVALLLRISDQVASQVGEGPPTELTVPAGGGR